MYAMEHENVRTDMEVLQYGRNKNIIIREQKKNSVLADTVILGHNLLTNIIKVRASAMAYRPK